MEHVRPNPGEILFSSRLLNRFRPDHRERKPKVKKEPSQPLHRMIYNRSGNLATTTKLNEESADGFMRRADMRSDIFIVDSTTPPEHDTVAVSSDTLAFRAIEPIRKLTEITFRPKSSHTLVRQEDRYEIQVHERAIDDQIRSQGYIDRSDYEEQFLGMLNKTVSSGVSEALSQEKLGLRDYVLFYGVYGITTSYTLVGFYNHPPVYPILIIPAAIVVYGAFIHPIGHVGLKATFLSHNPNHPAIRHSWKEFPLPFVPVDKWIAGKLYLAKHGQEMVILKASQESIIKP